MNKNFRPGVIFLTALLLLLNGCASTVIGTATDAAIEVAKIPFKVGAAVIDVVTGDDDDDEDEEDDEDD